MQTIRTDLRRALDATRPRSRTTAVHSRRASDVSASAPTYRASQDTSAPGSLDDDYDEVLQELVNDAKGG
jgi:hypothetical protein